MVLLLDNQDSFVHNLARYFRLAGAATEIIRSNQITAENVLARQPQAIVLSPGPHGPLEAGCCVDLVRSAPESLPILGVCLGHQAIGAAFGAQIVRNQPRHGMASPVDHDGEHIFADCPSPMNVARYHSLSVSADELPDCVKVTATSLDDNVVMGIRHQTRPVFGVQFHPEAVLCEYGSQIVQRFVSLTTEDS